MKESTKNKYAQVGMHKRILCHCVRQKNVRGYGYCLTLQKSNITLQNPNSVVDL